MDDGMDMGGGDIGGDLGNSDVSADTGGDLGGDLAGDGGADLNADIGGVEEDPIDEVPEEDLNGEEEAPVVDEMSEEDLNEEDDAPVDEAPKEDLNEEDEAPRVDEMPEEDLDGIEENGLGGEEGDNLNGEDTGDDPNQEAADEPIEDADDDLGEDPGEDTGDDPNQEAANEPIEDAGDGAGEDPGEDTGDDPNQEAADEPVEDAGDGEDDNQNADESDVQSAEEGDDLNDEESDDQSTEKGGDLSGEEGDDQSAEEGDDLNGEDDDDRSGEERQEDTAPPDSKMEDAAPGGGRGPCPICGQESCICDGGSDNPPPDVTCPICGNAPCTCESGDGGDNRCPKCGQSPCVCDTSNTGNEQTSARDRMSEYMNSHNYGREDSATYMTDPEWVALNRDLQNELGISQTPLDKMNDYMSSHNYGREDYRTYSNDPEWQELNQAFMNENSGKSNASDATPNTYDGNSDIPNDDNALRSDIADDDRSTDAFSGDELGDKEGDDLDGEEGGDLNGEEDDDQSTEGSDDLNGEEGGEQSGEEGDTDNIRDKAIVTDGDATNIDMEEVNDEAEKEEKRSADAIEKKYESYSAKDIVSQEEYQEYQQMYDHFDKMDIPQEYKDVLVECYKNMDNALKQEYNQYAPQLNVVDASYADVAHYNSVSKEIKMNCGRDIGDERGAGNTYFHETGHAIDHIKGLEAGEDSGITAQHEFTQSVRGDLVNALRNIRAENNCSWREARNILNDELASNPAASNIVSDVFGGVTKNRIRGDYTWGHENDYWAGHGGAKSSIIGQEAFAGINANICTGNTEAISFTSKYMPATMAKYQSIMRRS